MSSGDDVDDVLHQSAHLFLLMLVTSNVCGAGGLDVDPAPVAKDHPITFALLHDQRLDVGPDLLMVQVSNLELCRVAIAKCQDECSSGLAASAALANCL